MEWYYVWWPWLTSKRVARVCQHQLSFLFSFPFVTERLRYCQLIDSRLSKKRDRFHQFNVADCEAIRVTAAKQKRSSSWPLNYTVAYFPLKFLTHSLPSNGPSSGPELHCMGSYKPPVMEWVYVNELIQYVFRCNVFRRFYTGHAIRFVKRCTRTKFGEFSFSGPAAWNMLPDDLQRCVDTNVFKKQLKTFLFQLAVN